jgi:hypothetical protein
MKEAGRGGGSDRRERSLEKRRKNRSAVNSGDIVDKLEIIRCRHTQQAVIWWVENRPGYPPEVGFTNLPQKGRLVLSVQTIQVLCNQCLTSEPGLNQFTRCDSH